MTNEGLLLLDAVLANPDEDSPRAMLADWLQDQEAPHSQWYGRFIAAQLSGEPWKEKILFDTLIGYACYDFSRFGVRLHHTPNVYGYTVTHWTSSVVGNPEQPIFDVNRGFVVGAAVNHSSFIAGAGALFVRHPVKHVHLADCVPAFGPNHYWYRADRDITFKHPYHLSPVLYDLLQAPEEAANGYRRKTYESSQAAMQALQFVVLQYGRAEAIRWREHNSP